MQKTIPLLALALLATPALPAGPEAIPLQPPGVAQPGGKNLWRASVVALAATNLMDAHSSWGKYELNPNLSGSSGRFAREGALVKLAIVGGTFAVQAVVLHRKPSAKLYRKLSLVNFVSASVTGAVSIRNYGIPRP